MGNEEDDNDELVYGCGEEGYSIITEDGRETIVSYDEKLPEITQPEYPENNAPVSLQVETPWAPTDVETSPEKESQLKQEIQSCIDKLEHSEYFSAFLAQVRSIEATDDFKLTKSAGKINMVTYGLGNFHSSKLACYQLSLAILMKKKVEWIGGMEAFDPVFSLTETNVLKELGVSVLYFNELGKRKALNPTIFFMPHCHADLYENLLKANWEHNLLNKIILIGNSFMQIREPFLVRAKIGRQTSDHSKDFILATLPFTKEFQIPVVSDELHKAFHSTSWHFFTVDPDTNLELT